MDEILIEEKKYISSKQAAKITGYAKDYIGQLCREGRVPARLIGRSWYVLESAIQDHKFGSEAEEPKKTVTSKWQSPRYEVDMGESFPALKHFQEETKLPADTSSVSEKEEPSVPERVEESWKAWFERFDHVTDLGNTNAEVKGSKEEERAVATEEPEEETRVPIHAMTQANRLPPEELLPRHQDTSVRQKEMEVPRRMSSKRGEKALWSIQVAGVLLALIAVSVAVIGSGYFDSYVTSFRQAGIISGIVIYNK